MKGVLQDPDRLAALRGTGLLDSPPSEVFDRITRIGASLLNVPATFVALVDAHRDFYLSHYGFGEPLATTRELAGQTFCHFTVSGGTPLVIQDTRADPVYRKVPTVESLGVAAYLGIPLKLKTGAVIGSFCVIDNSPHAWTVAEVERVEELASMVVAEIEQHRQDAATLTEGAKRAAVRDWAHDGVYDMDNYGRCTFINPAGASMLGYTPEELLGKPIHATIYHSYADSRPHPLSDCPIRICCVRGVRASVSDDVFWRKDGTSVPVSYDAAPFKVADTVIGAVVRFRDVTTRMLAEGDKAAGLAATQA